MEPRSLHDLKDVESEYGRLPDDYRDFVMECGKGSFYRDPWGGLGHIVMVLGPPEVQEAPGTMKKVVRINLGYYVNTGYAWLEWINGKYSDGLFVGIVGQRRRAAHCFQEWLQRSFRSAKKLYTKESWAELLQPPRPFDVREQEIVTAIPHFAFHKVGVTEGGKVKVRVANRSQIELLYLTIGVRDPGRMTGGVVLPVSGIPPGGVRVLEEELYRGSMDPQRVELFRRPLPDPEDRPYFAEFRTAPLEGATSFRP